MSGLEIVAGVCAIVSAFNGSVNLFRAWREKRTERREKEQNQNLERSLTIGGTTIQGEYDVHFARLGQQFAIGDGESLCLELLLCQLRAIILSVRRILNILPYLLEVG